MPVHLVAYCLFIAMYFYGVKLHDCDCYSTFKAIIMFTLFSYIVIHFIYIIMIYGAPIVC